MSPSDRPLADKRRVVVLGGGMAGLAAAWSLSAPGWQDRFASITIYQRGACLGGKGASTRGVNGRIEEHGLHVWLGYYENAFALLREVYSELDRPSRDPGCPIGTLEDAFLPAGAVGVGDESDGLWMPWVARFGADQRQAAGVRPPSGSAGGQVLSVADFVRRGVELLAALSASLDMPARPPGGDGSREHGVFLTASPLPPSRSSRLATGLTSLAGFGALLRRAEMASLIAGVQALGLLQRAVPGAEGPVGVVIDQLGRLRAELAHRTLRARDGRRLWQVVDLIAGCVLGAVEDGLLADPEGFARIDHLDFRQWLSGRVSSETLESPLITGLYDLVFAYEDGDRERPAFAAGLGLFLAGRLFFEYRGAMFWKMRAGMGDVVFVPLHQALVARGVRVELFCRVDALELDAEGTALEIVRLGRQIASVRREDGALGHDGAPGHDGALGHDGAPGDDGALGDHGARSPFRRVAGLPCYPNTLPSGQRKAAAPADAGAIWADRSTEAPAELRAGRDFDVVVLAVGLGMVPHIAADLVERLPAWRSMVDGVRTVATRALQVWLRPTESELGWEHPGATLSACPPPFDSFASMSHLVEVETWPDDERPATIGYFCSVLPDEPGALDADRQVADADAAAHVLASVAADAADFLDRGAGRFWPRARSADGRFRWELLCGSGSAVGRERLAGQYVRANIDPSDRYVQSVPGSGAHRLRVDQSGVENLVLAGDWVNCGLNAGCVEAAVMAGLQVANTILGRPLTYGLSGRWYGLEPGPGADRQQPGPPRRRVTGSGPLVAGRSPAGDG